MIELVYEIRRFVPSEVKPEVKLANPELFEILRRYYHGTATAVTKALIKELFHLAGGEWPGRLNAKNAATPGQTVKAYRGQISLEQREENQPARPSENLKTAQKIYRGRVVPV